MPDYTPHQRKIIERYYDRSGEILLARLQEIVTDLYLADTGRKIDQLWKRADKAMTGLKVPDAVRAHVLEQRKVEVLARHVRTWLDKAKPPSRG